CKSKLHRPLEKWNLNFHFRPDSFFSIFLFSSAIQCYNETAKQSRDFVTESTAQTEVNPHEFTTINPRKP
ncbi:hypothetical protein, partial [Clostridium sp. OM02-18AC]|uniref:hypothetical protein n=1 Tax=Clostridium sp. OM02-18AC TaxID=2292311 RepID=UPI001A9B06BD